MGDRAPAYRDPALHFDALRLVALRERGRTEETLATENEREMLIRAPAHVHQAHAALCCWSKHVAHSQSALRTGLMAPAWRPALCIRLLHVWKQRAGAGTEEYKPQAHAVVAPPLGPLNCHVLIFKYRKQTRALVVLAHVLDSS